jgi:hypothetical protein
MDTKTIFKLSAELTTKEIANVLTAWANEGDAESIKEFNTLVKLGDSRELALATVMCDKANKKENSEMYQIAYYS